MPKSSPYEPFDPNCLSWLHRKHARDEPVARAQVDNLVAMNPDSNDALLKRYIMAGARGDLNKKRGRPPDSPIHDYLTLQAFLSAHKDQEKIWAARRSGDPGGGKRMRGEL